MEYQINKDALITFLKNRTNEMNSERDFILSKIALWMPQIENGLSSSNEKKKRKKKER